MFDAEIIPRHFLSFLILFYKIHGLISAIWRIPVHRFIRLSPIGQPPGSLLFKFLFFLTVTTPHCWRWSILISLQSRCSVQFLNSWQSVVFRVLTFEQLVSSYFFLIHHLATFVFLQVFFFVWERTWLHALGLLLLFNWALKLTLPFWNHSHSKVCLRNFFINLLFLFVLVLCSILFYRLDYVCWLMNKFLDYFFLEDGVRLFYFWFAFSVCDWSRVEAFNKRNREIVYLVESCKTAIWFFVLFRLHTLLNARETRQSFVGCVLTHNNRQLSFAWLQYQWEFAEERCRQKYGVLNLNQGAKRAIVVLDEIFTTKFFDAWMHSGDRDVISNPDITACISSDK